MRQTETISFLLQFFFLDKTNNNNRKQHSKHNFFFRGKKMSYFIIYEITFIQIKVRATNIERENDVKLFVSMRVLSIWIPE